MSFGWLNWDHHKIQEIRLSEGGVVLGGHAMNRDVAMRNMARLNQLWDGRIGATDRVTSESSDNLISTRSV